MLAEEIGLENAIQQWRALPAGDRKAILKCLPSDRRLAFLRLLSESGGALSPQTARARRYHAYSPWLADLIQDCESPGPTTGGLTSNVRGALLAEHEKLVSQGEAFADRSLLSSLARKMARWLDGLR